MSYRVQQLASQAQVHQYSSQPAWISCCCVGDRGHIKGACARAECCQHRSTPNCASLTSYGLFQPICFCICSLYALLMTSFSVRSSCSCVLVVTVVAFCCCACTGVAVTLGLLHCERRGRACTPLCCCCCCVQLLLPLFNVCMVMLQP